MKQKKIPIIISSKKIITALLPGVFLLIFFGSCQKVTESNTTPVVQTAVTEDDLKGSSKPNVVIILGDDIGYEIPTINGGQSYSTPNIDKMATGGVRFRQCYGAPNCSPSRFMLLTGKYNFRNYTTWGVMDLSQKTIGNMFKDGGYATCYAGKWQLDGGDNSIHTFGFDKYSVWLDYEIQPEEAYGPRYKSPVVLQDGAYLPSSQTQDKYSVDIYTKYITNFIDSNKAKPFLVYYSIPLAHKIFSPTPNDPEWATWDFTWGDSKFFPEMIAYMDSQVGILTNKINSLGLKRKTIFIFLGDNGSPKGITSQYNGITVPGEKGQSTTYGTHVPFMVSWPGHTTAGKVTDQLVDFTDFMPTLANLTGLPVPTTYGTLDGKDFSKVITTSATTTTKDYVFLHWDPAIGNASRQLVRYAGNSTYKLYDGSGYFYNVVKDIEETYPIPADSLTSAELQTKTYFQEVLNSLH